MLPSAHTALQAQAFAGAIAWNNMPDDLQLALAREALRRAAEHLAGQAELLAGAIDDGTLLDQGGPEGLRLFASLMRSTNKDDFDCVGNA